MKVTSESCNELTFNSETLVRRTIVDMSTPSFRCIGMSECEFRI